MTILLTILSAIMLLFGIFFFVVGVVGIYRLPDAHSRLHAAGKVATLGLFGLLVGAALLDPALAPRLLLLGLFFLLTAPVASHAIALSHRIAPDPREAFRAQQQESARSN